MKFEKERKKREGKRGLSKKTILITIIGIIAVAMIVLPLLLGGLK